MIRECTCPTEHTIAKLGHCATCDYYARDCYENDAPSRVVSGLLVRICPPSHCDGTPHDFTWATYADAESSFGVCRCGLGAIDFDLMHSEEV